MCTNERNLATQTLPIEHSDEGRKWTRRRLRRQAKCNVWSLPKLNVVTPANHSLDLNSAILFLPMRTAMMSAASL